MIAYPIDLNTIKTRLENRFYRNIEAVKFDVNFIESNARKYNEPFSSITRDAKIVTYLVLEFINKQELEDPTVITQDVQQNKEMFESTESESEEEEELRVQTKGKKKNDPNWIRECRHFISELFRKEDSEPFRNPVDLNDYEDYLEKVSSPMDLSTIREQLMSGNYEDPKDLNKDLKLIFQNSKLYNTDKRSVIFLMTLRLQSYVNEQMKHILEHYKQEQLNAIKKSNRKKTVVNGSGKAGKRRSYRNSQSSTEQQHHASKYYSTRNSENHHSTRYTNGHGDKATSSKYVEIENSDDEDYRPSAQFRGLRPDNKQQTSRPRRQIKQQKVNSGEEEHSDEVSVDEETELEDNLTDAEQTEDQSDEEEESFTSRKSARLTNGSKSQSSSSSNRQSIKRKRAKRKGRKSIKKMKLTNGAFFKGRKASLTTESDQNTSITDNSATDIEIQSARRGGNARKGASSSSGSRKQSSNNKNDNNGIRKSKRGRTEKSIDYSELNNSDYELDEQPESTVSSRGRLRKAKRY